MNVFDLYAKIALDTGDYEKGLDDASVKTSSFADKLKTGLATAAKVGAAAIGAAAAGIAALTKSSIEGYAEYEQLVGGVETLFKQSADAVQQYAANAYKTAGMSANEYMDTVTSFSASLLQSLDGDTAAAAEKANLAITDMSDNANKMGTSMEMIQNAYQGFAKQNYTMLDNLKLGYGGTKEEMQRLLDDAEKLSGQKFDLSSYGDIVDAIHVVQTEMGITGTTAAEAASTIQGSVSAVKAAWSNLLTGIADENANLDDLIGNFTESVATAGENIIPRIEHILSGMGTAIAKLAPVISGAVSGLVTNVLPSLLNAGVQLIDGILQGLTSALPMLASSAISIINRIVELLSDPGNLSMLLTAAAETIITLAKGISESIPELIPAIVSIVVQIVETLTSPDTISGLIDAAISIIFALADGLIEALPILIEKVPEIVINLVTAIIENAPKLLEAALELVAMLATGIWNGLVEICTKMNEWIYVNIAKPIKDAVNDFKEAGKNLIDGLWNGLKEVWESVANWFSDSWNSIINWFGGLWDSFVSIGSDIINAIWSGLKSAWESVSAWFSDAWGSIKGIFSGGVDVKMNASGSVSGSHASGLWNVPYDGYIAEVHKGEMIVPAKEAKYLRKGMGGVNITQNIYSEAKTAAELMQEAMWEAERAVLMGV